MEITRNDTRKIVELWIAKSEQTSDGWRTALHAIAARYRPLGYTVAVFRSGAGDLTASTCELLARNNNGFI
ncbi:hypothetical protein LJC34_05065 [Oscillospiraceae bacterium OttesenSCG-928-G22]|nr:hypothetical protein [Oscillospiraceae bacterium OttesenSCG-928-G22]